jgi:hypothetical protein
MNSYDGINVGDPVQYTEDANIVGKVDQITPLMNSHRVFIAVKLAGWKYAVRIYAPDKLKVCRCVNRSPMQTPLGQTRELQHAR